MELLAVSRHSTSLETHNELGDMRPNPFANSMIGICHSTPPEATEQQSDERPRLPPVLTPSRSFQSTYEQALSGAGTQAPTPTQSSGRRGSDEFARSYEELLNLVTPTLDESIARQCSGQSFNRHPFNSLSTDKGCPLTELLDRRTLTDPRVGQLLDAAEELKKRSQPPPSSSTRSDELAEVIAPYQLSGHDSPEQLKRSWRASQLAAAVNAVAESDDLSNVKSILRGESSASTSNALAACVNPRCIRVAPVINPSLAHRFIATAQNLCAASQRGDLMGVDLDRLERRVRHQMQTESDPNDDWPSPDDIWNESVRDGDYQRALDTVLLLGDQASQNLRDQLSPPLDDIAGSPTHDNHLSELRRYLAQWPHYQFASQPVNFNRQLRFASDSVIDPAHYAIWWADRKNCGLSNRELQEALGNLESIRRKLNEQQCSEALTKIYQRSSEVHCIDHNQWGQFLTQQFEAMRRVKQSFKSFFVALKDHALALALHRSSDRVPVYTVDIYDPNRTDQPRHLRVNFLGKLAHYDLGKLVAPSWRDLYAPATLSCAMAYALPSPHQPLIKNINHAIRCLNSQPARINSFVTHQILARGFHGDIEALEYQLACLAKHSPAQIVALLEQTPPDGQSILDLTFVNKLTSLRDLLIQGVSASALSRHEQINLLQRKWSTKQVDQSASFSSLPQSAISDMLVRASLKEVRSASGPLDWLEEKPVR